MWRNSSEPLFFTYRSIILNGLSACEKECVGMPIETKLEARRERRRKRHNTYWKNRLILVLFQHRSFPFWRREKKKKFNRLRFSVRLSRMLFFLCVWFEGKPRTYMNNEYQRQSFFWPVRVERKFFSSSLSLSFLSVQSENKHHIKQFQRVYFVLSPIKSKRTFFSSSFSSLSLDALPFDSTLV